MSPRRRHLYVYILTAACALTTLLCVYSVVHTNNTPTHPASSSSGSSGSSRKGFVVDTPACHILDFDPFDPSLRHLVLHTGSLECDVHDQPLTFIDKEWLRINATLRKRHNRNETTRLDYCEYQAILRPKVTNGQASPDNTYTYNKTVVRFSADIRVHDQFVRVVCYDVEGNMIYSNFHAFVLFDKKRDMTLHRRRKKLKTKPRETLNIIVLGIDAISRLNFMRQMPKTRRFLLRQLSALEYKGYNKVADNTFVNLAPMFAGKFVEELGWDEMDSDQTFDRYNFIWKNFSQYGYRTLFAEDAPTISIFNYAKEGFREPPTDYYLRPFSLALEDHGSIWNHDHDCVAERPETQVVLDYMKAFLEKFQHDPHFAFGFITRLTHDNINKAGLADMLYFKFFQQLFNGGLLNNTAVIFFSDHGMRFGEIRETYIGKMEERLPFLYLLFPAWFREKYTSIWNNLETNRNRLVTPFDLYETLKDMLTFNPGKIKDTASSGQKKRAISLLSEMPIDRSCEDAGILPHWCTCHETNVADPRDPVIVNAASAVVSKINTHLHSQTNSACSKLTLNRVTNALQIVHGNAQSRHSRDQNKDWENMVSQNGYQSDLYSDDYREDMERDDRNEYGEVSIVPHGASSESVAVVTYLVTFSVAPGNGLFEATVRVSLATEMYDVVGDISRINRYGDQAYCINSDALRKYCYCI